MTSAKEAADNLQNAIDDTRKVLRTATQGKGLVATLLNNQQLANDPARADQQFESARRLFYRDSAATTQTRPQEQPKPASSNSGSLRSSEYRIALMRPVFWLNRIA